MDFIFLIQARLGSTRLPGKMLLKVYSNKSLLEVVYQRVLLSKYANNENVFVVTSHNTEDDILEKYLVQKNIKYYRGDEDNVYKRFLDFMISHNFDTKYIFRICGDNPLVEPIFIDEMVQYLKKEDTDYLSYKDNNGKPAILTHYGFFCESINLSAFEQANSLITSDYEKQNVTPIFYNSDHFKKIFFKMPDILNKHDYRFTVDTKEDLYIIKNILNSFHEHGFTYKDVVRMVENNPLLLKNMKENILMNSKEQK